MFLFSAHELVFATPPFTWLWRPRRVRGECRRMNSFVALIDINPAGKVSSEQSSPRNPSPSLCPASWPVLPVNVDIETLETDKQTFLAGDTQQHTLSTQPPRGSLPPLDTSLQRIRCHISDDWADIPGEIPVKNMHDNL